MADQTLPLNVSDEMKLDDERQNCILLRQATHADTSPSIKLSF